MSKLILVSATSFEIEPTLQFLSPFKQTDGQFRMGDLVVQVCITGVGMVNTAFALGQFSGTTFDYALNAGLAGAFGDLSNGSVVRVKADCFSELGAESGDAFISIDDLGFGQQNVLPLKEMELPVILSLPAVRGITVNTVHGAAKSIEEVKIRFSPEVETMEGAAFFEAANRLGWTCAQIRAISNKVEIRNRDNWEIGLALRSLNTQLVIILKAIAQFPGLG